MTVLPAVLQQLLIKILKTNKTAEDEFTNHF